MSTDTPRLGSSLIARKGDAAPTATLTPISAKTYLPEPEKTDQPMPKGLAGTIAVTVRLDPARYERLKIHGARQRLSNQQILVEALDAYLTTTVKQND
jgi:hypothetical protein